MGFCSKRRYNPLARLPTSKLHPQRKKKKNPHKRSANGPTKHFSTYLSSFQTICHANYSPFCCFLAIFEFLLLRFHKSTRLQIFSCIEVKRCCFVLVRAPISSNLALIDYLKLLFASLYPLCLFGPLGLSFLVKNTLACWFIWTSPPFYDSFPLFPSSPNASNCNVEQIMLYFGVQRKSWADSSTGQSADRAQTGGVTGWIYSVTQHMKNPSTIRPKLIWALCIW